MLIVSNSAGTKDDFLGEGASVLEHATGVPVFRHSTKKPGCGPLAVSQLMRTSLNGLEKPSQIAVIGDRLFTDVMMANMIGAWSIWIKNGVIEDHGAVCAHLHISEICRLI